MQKHFNNFIPPEAVEIVAKECGVPLSKVYEVLTFYTMFSTKPRGKYIIRVCASLPCHVTGGREIVETLKEVLGIDFGETTEDGLFTLEKTSCLGLCGVSPVIMINEDFYGNLTPERVREIIEEIRKKERVRVNETDRGFGFCRFQQCPSWSKTFSQLPQGSCQGIQSGKYRGRPGNG